MKAVAIFPGSREVKLIDAAEPRLTRPSDVRLRMLDVGGHFPIDAYVGPLLDAPTHAIKNVIALS